MMKQSDLVKPKSLEDCGSHGYTNDEFEEYSEEEMLSEEEPNENLCMSPKKEGSCEELNKLQASSAEEPNEDGSSDEEPAEEVPFGDEFDDEDSCPEEPSEEDPIEESEAETAEYPTNEITLEKVSDEDPSDVSFEEIVEEESSEESEEEPNEEEPLSSSMDQPPRLLKENKASDQIISASKPSAESSFNHCQRESNNLSTDATVSKQPGDPLTSRKKRRSGWDMKAETPMLLNECGDQDKKRSRWSSDTKAGASIPENDNTVLNKSRRTRWSNDKTQFNFSDTVKLPDSVKDILSNVHNDKRIERLNAKLQEIHQKLEGSMIINKPQKESSSSPQPIDVGLDLNESSVRLKLLKQKNEIILELLRKIKKEDQPKHRSIHSYKFCKKLYIPLKEYPNYNFVGLILGPSGNGLKRMEAEAGATILIRGKGSDIRDKGSSSDDELHVLILSDSQICLDAAVSMVEKLLVPVDDSYNYRKSAQLRELAELKGIRVRKSWEMDPCVICGMPSHPTSACPLSATESKTSPNYLTGSGSLFSSFKSPPISPPPLPSVVNAHGDKPKGFDLANLFVGLLPQSVTIDKLKELFLPYGTICSATVLMDKSTGRSKGCGFVKYTNASDASNAIEKMNGYLIDGRKLAVRIAGTFAPSNANLPNNAGFVSIPPPSLISNQPKFPCLPYIPQFYNANLPNYQGINPPSTSNVNLPNYLGLASIPLSSNANLPNCSELAAIPQTIPKPNSWPGPAGSELAAIPQSIPKPNNWPGPAGSMLPESGISFLKSNYNSFTCTESVPLQSPKSLVSSFQTSLVKDGYMMDGKKLNVENLPNPSPLLSASLPNYPQFAAIPTEIPGSILPESRTSFPTNSYNSLKHTESVPFRSSTYLGSACQTSISSSQFHGVTAISNELATFPGYLKSIDPPNQLDQSIPSSSLSSQAAYFTENFSGNHISPDWR
ncbi:uncharacterized protein LOC110021522 isoform X2 [Phalaenopsis equestris]|uniref:uncharacterized protein LOC110021522 isoform X2 n=1 Tax=Phalaenopsis equestris TaxID=78828 RepID=UPI0009E35317|nr:uncharacterized protein LOC110021522 isoform X2 [Phalaenopsis equestris]